MTEVQESPRKRLVKAAAALLAAGGLEAVQTRKLAAETGTSTMAVYTYFGGMPQLVGALVEHGFRLFADELAASPVSDDPVADLLTQGFAYRHFAVENQQLYRLMFGLTSAGTRTPADVTSSEGIDTGFAAGAEAYDHLVHAIERVLASGRVSSHLDPHVVAARVWTIAHGYVLLEIAGFVGSPQHGQESVLHPLLRALVLELGDQPERFDASVAAALR